MVFSMVFITSFHSSFSTRFSTVFSQILANKDKLEEEWNRRKARWITQQEEGGLSFLDSQSREQLCSFCKIPACLNAFLRSSWLRLYSDLKAIQWQKVDSRISPKTSLHKDYSCGVFLFTLTSTARLLLDTVFTKKTQITKWPTVSLAIQELHDWLQNVVSILGYAAGISHIRGALHLSQDISHLLHILFYMRLEALAEKQRKH